MTLIVMREKGFTLIELLVAFVIGIGIALLAYQALSSAINIEQRVSTVTAQTNRLHRVWQLLNDDLQHAVARPWVDFLGNQQVAMLGVLGDRVSQSSDISLSDSSHLLRFVRSGENNFLGLPRSNLQLVGYRLVENESDNNEEKKSLSLWRDYWRPIDSVTEPTVKSRLLLENVEAINFRYLPKESQTTESDAWVTGWPSSDEQNEQLPIAVEVTIDVAGMGEIMRLFSLVKTDE